MDPTAAERRLAAILIADVVGYSRLMAEDEAATLHTLADYREEVALLVGQHRGRLVNFTGDNFLAEFASAVNAVRCALDIQSVVRGRNAHLPPERKMEFRIGAHLGEVRVEHDSIFGDGVNIAARLEPLAAPGGICLSGTLREQLRSKLELEYEDLGERTLKNIADPVRVYRIQPQREPKEPTHRSAAKRKRARRLRAALVATVAIVLLIGVGLWASWPRPLDLLIDIAGVSGPPVEPALPGKPSLVVLPFNNLSREPEQEYLADGLTEDIITLLSRSGRFGVVARTSTFAYKDAARDAREVGRELGARYVLEGSVRRLGARIRVTAQLVDTESGTHVWAERYDRPVAEFFELQDEVTAAIVASVHPQVQLAVAERIRRRAPESLESWELTHRVLSSLLYGVQAFREGENLELSRRAVELDPDNARAHAVLAWSIMGGLFNTPNARVDPSDPLVQEALAAGRRAVELDRDDPTVLYCWAFVQFAAHRRDEALRLAERALQIDPNDAQVHGLLAYVLISLGREEEGIQNVEQAIRLSPRDPRRYLWHFYLARAAFNLGRYEEAASQSRLSLDLNPEMYNVWSLLASSLAHLGRREEASSALDEMRRLQPDLSWQQWQEVLEARIGSREAAAREVAGLREAGVNATEDDR